MGECFANVIVQWCVCNDWFDNYFWWSFLWAQMGL